VLIAARLDLILNLDGSSRVSVTSQAGETIRPPWGRGQDFFSVWTSARQHPSAWAGGRRPDFECGDRRSAVGHRGV